MGQLEACSVLRSPLSSVFLNRTDQSPKKNEASPVLRDTNPPTYKPPGLSRLVLVAASLRQAYFYSRQRNTAP
jgi:hypothetical protein